MNKQQLKHTQCDQSEILFKEDWTDCQPQDTSKFEYTPHAIIQNRISAQFKHQFNHESTTSTYQFNKHEQQVQQQINEFQIQIKYIVSQQDYNTISANIRGMLANNIQPLPKLRRQIPFTSLNSAYQLELADLYDSKRLIYRVQAAQTEQLQQILVRQNICQLSIDYLLRIRFQPETLQNSKDKNKIVRLVAILCGLIQSYLKMIQGYLSFCRQHTDNLTFLKIFNDCYCKYSSTIVNLHNYFGFIFTVFEMKFNRMYKRYETDPKFSILRTGIKKWIVHMTQFAQVNTLCYSLLYCTLVKHQINSHLKSQHQQISMISQQFPGNMEDLVTNFCDYTQYLMDISVNEYSVHFCGNSSQILTSAYMVSEKAIQSANECIWNQLASIKPTSSMKNMYQNVLKYLNAMLPARTFVKILQFGKVHFQIQDRYSKQIEIYDREQTYINMYKQIFQDFDQVYTPLLDMDAQSSVQAIIGIFGKLDQTQEVEFVRTELEPVVSKKVKLY